MKSSSRFQRWAQFTFLVTLLLVFVGGFVRVSGSGLGCPDWPRCWGCWLPPQSLEQVKLDEVLLEFQEKRPHLVMADLTRLFDPFKMWVEYINRLLGVLVGLLVIGQFLAALFWRRDSKALLFWSFFAVPLVAFQGWLGGQVVKTGLDSAKISAHLFGAAALLAVLAWITANAGSRPFRIVVEEVKRFRYLLFWTVILLIGTVVQGVLGVRVRSGIDEVTKSSPELARGDWLGQIAELDHQHRLFAWVVVLATVAVVWFARKVEGKGLLRAIFICVALQIAAGIGLGYLDFPKAAQVIHLGVGALLLCLVFLLAVSIRHRKVLVVEPRS